jgi:phytanoyl-CoA hydroxylase
MIQVAEDVAADDPYATLVNGDEVRRYYADHGYVVVRGLVPAAVCDAARAAFVAEIKPYPGYLYRQASANPERHVLTPEGHVLNSLLNIQDVGRRRFPRFWEAGMAVVTAPSLQRAVASLLGEPGRVVQSMYFDGNPSTWAHQDTYYLDARPLGAMTAAWVALEPIHPGAGRFYVYPGSHRIDMAKNGGDFDIAFNHDRYKALVLDVIRRKGLQCHAPALATGDVLFWSSRTIHGSLATTAPKYSRSSVTAHFIPRSAPFLQYQVRERALQLQTINGVEVHCPKDQDRWTKRAVMRFETLLPSPYKAAKRAAVKMLTR